MKPDQIDKQLTWMDEQRRKDTEHISTLERKLDSAVELVNLQQNQIKQLSSEITRLSALTTRIKQFDDSLDKQRESFSQKLADSESALMERQKHQEDLRKHDYEMLSKSVAELGEENRGFKQVMDIEVRKQEEIRLSRKLNTLEEKVDTLIQTTEEQSRNVNSVDEARKLDAKRIVDLQSESTEHRLRLDSQRGVLDTVEDRTRRMETRVEDITNSIERRKEIYSLWEEKQELRMVEFEKKWKVWEAKFDEFQQKAEDVDERIIKYDENYRALSQARLELDNIIEKLERRITEISEMQRIGEERIKHEWSSFQADEQKRWNTHKLVNDEQWREHSRMHEKIAQEMNSLDEKLSDGMVALEELTENSTQKVIDLLTIVRQWAGDIDREGSRIR